MKSSSFAIACWSFLLAISVLTPAPDAQAETLQLPRKVAIPEVHPAPDGKQAQPNADAIPLPEPRPAEPVTAPVATPVPTAAPERPSHEAKDKELDGDAKEEPSPAMDTDPRSGKSAETPMPSEEMACRARLKTLGVAFEDMPAESSFEGCSLPYPVSVSSLGHSISLEPKALMNCAMAEAVARFSTSVVTQAAEASYGHQLTRISHASAYVCRPRNGTRKLSEHAFGNALDIVSFTLDDKTSIDVKADADPRATNFLSAVRTAACGPFKTVLGPGSNADHALHLHFDLAPRKHGGTYCK